MSQTKNKQTKQIPTLSYYQQQRRDLINITSYITIRFYICALSSSSKQSTLRVFLTYSPRSNTTPSITLLSFEFTTGNTWLAKPAFPPCFHSFLTDAGWLRSD